MAIYVTAVDGMTSFTAADASAPQTDLISQEGVIGTTGTDLEVHAQDTPDMTVKVKKGSCFVQRDAYVASDNTTKFWHVIVTADTNVTITANSSGQTRVDRICVKFDTSVTPDANASNVATLVAVAGTPGAGAPNVPNNHLSLAQVTVTDGETAINTGDITDERTFIGLVLPYAHGYRLKDTGANLDAQIYEDSSGRVIMRSAKSGGAFHVDPTDDTIRAKGWEGDDLAVVSTSKKRFNTQTDSYTLVAADAGKIVLMNKGSANNLTVPPNSSVAFPTGTIIGIIQIGAGQTTVVAGSGVTVNVNSALTLLLTGQHSVAVLVKRDTNTWVLGGDLQAA